MKKTLLFLLLILTACAQAVTTPLPTAVPTSTPLPTATATITPTATPVPNGPCDSPLLPLTTGNEWTYRVTTESGESLYTLKALNRDDGGNVVINVEFTNQKTGAKVVEPVVCMDGAIENFPLFLLDMHFSNYLVDDFNTYHDTGIYAPSYPFLMEKNWSTTWEAKYLTEDYVNIKNPMGGSDLVVMQSSSIELSFKADGTRETVAVPAGNYLQALKVKNSTSFPVTLTLPTGGTGGVLTLETTQWYEPYVGLVRAQVDKASLALNQQDLTIPVLNLIELVEFKAGSR
jgi:hypothetical protein